ncbi:hypothetical protein NSU_2418 [Novosphingobium pentaromativorans US6-1]|uniref:Uncharacterized protein n=1 Tax=Novosphingobium pentaromativorans US6-1 TaxID=1088721 RepID=G6EDJ8_9SPHN|nr:hypothetical protein NSU_2418 [Novosphingobium pentaromativorans US6-1]
MREFPHPVSPDMLTGPISPPGAALKSQDECRRERSGTINVARHHNPD